MSMHLTVRDLMTDSVYTVHRRTSLADVQLLMLENGFRHVPVVDDDDEVLGLVSQRDVTAALGAAARGDLTGQQARLADLTASQAMTTPVETIGPDDDLRSAAELMIENKYGCLPVVEGRHLVGIITESDFVRFVASRLGA
jgi:CBS domain-containing membrane protein